MLQYSATPVNGAVMLSPHPALSPEGEGTHPALSQRERGRVYDSSTASSMAIMFSGGTSARMLWTCWKTKPPPGERIETCSADVAADFLRRAAREGPAGFAAAAPEGEPAAEVPLQARRLHARAGDLHRIDRVEPRVDQVVQQAAGRRRSSAA